MIEVIILILVTPFIVALVAAYDSAYYDDTNNKGAGYE